MSKQTALQWFLQELETEMQLGKNFNKSEQRIFDEIKQETLQMEREQIVDAYVECYMNHVGNGESILREANSYYKNTYGGHIGDANEMIGGQDE